MIVSKATICDEIAKRVSGEKNRRNKSRTKTWVFAVLR